MSQLSLRVNAQALSCLEFLTCIFVTPVDGEVNVSGLLCLGGCMSVECSGAPGKSNLCREHSGMR